MGGVTFRSQQVLQLREGQADGRGDAPHLAANKFFDYMKDKQMGGVAFLIMRPTSSSTCSVCPCWWCARARTVWMLVLSARYHIWLCQ